jgi:hypothetical protein
MTSHTRPGLFRRLLTALGDALERGILGKSGPAHAKQFGGDDEYWERAIAAELDWPQQKSPQVDPERFGRSGNRVMGAGSRMQESAGLPAGPEFEPVHGWTKRQFDDYLARNPGYRSTYEAQLQKCGRSATSEVNGSRADWFGPRRLP